MPEILEFTKARPGMVFLAGWVLFLFLWESLFPLRLKTTSRFWRYLKNIIITVAAGGVGFITVEAVTRVLGLWMSDNNYGLLGLTGVQGGIRFFIIFPVLDVTFYWWHRANHKIPVLWRFHNIHHLDPDLDLSTSQRFHFGEIAVSALFRVLQILLLGVSPSEFAVYMMWFQGSTFLHHANVRMPLAVEKYLVPLIVTPRMHGVHHSNYMNEADSNYSVIFSLWDRIFRSLRLNVKQSDLVIGVPGYALPEDNSLGRLAVMPFVPQKLHWRDGEIPHYKRVTEGDLSGMAE